MKRKPGRRVLQEWRNNGGGQITLGHHVTVTFWFQLVSRRNVRPSFECIKTPIKSDRMGLKTREQAQHRSPWIYRISDPDQKSLPTHCRRQCAFNFTRSPYTPSSSRIPGTMGQNFLLNYSLDGNGSDWWWGNYISNDNEIQELCHCMRPVC